MARELPYQRHEREFAEALAPVGCYPVPRSGAGLEKMDVATPPDPMNGHWLGLYGLKCTSGKGITVTAGMYREVERAAYQRSPRFRPMLGLRILGERGEVALDGVLVSVDDWVEQQAEMRDMRERLARTRPR